MKKLIALVMMLVAVNSFSYTMCDMDGGNCKDSRAKCNMDGSNCRLPNEICNMDGTHCRTM